MNSRSKKKKKKKNHVPDSDSATPIDHSLFGTEGTDEFTKHVKWLSKEAVMTDPTGNKTIQNAYIIAHMPSYSPGACVESNECGDERDDYCGDCSDDDDDDCDCDCDVVVPEPKPKPKPMPVVKLKPKPVTSTAKSGGFHSDQEVSTKTLKTLVYASVATSVATLGFALFGRHRRKNRN